MIGWDKAAFTGDSYNIYKESTPGVYTLIDNVPFGSLSVYFDLTSDPDVSSDSYKITSLDVLNNESAQSAAHTSMYLSTTVGMSGEINLQWSAYSGFTGVQYNIWKGATSSTLTLLDSVSSLLTSYVDINPLMGTTCYRIEIVNPAGCIPTDPPTDYSSSFSNTSCQTIASIENKDKKQAVKVSVMPNPFNEAASLVITGIDDYNNVSLEVYNIIGKRVTLISNITSSTIEIKRENLTEGLYVYQLLSNGKTLHTGKLVIQ